MSLFKREILLDKLFSLTCFFSEGALASALAMRDIMFKTRMILALEELGELLPPPLVVIYSSSKGDILEEHYSKNYCSSSSLICWLVDDTANNISVLINPSSFTNSAFVYFCLNWLTPSSKVLILLVGDSYLIGEEIL